MYRLLLILVILCFTMTTATAQKPTQSNNTKAKYSIPFHLTEYNNIVITGVLNNQDTVDLMLHTAASDVTLTEEAFVRLKTVKLDGTVDGVKSWGGSTNSSDFSEGNSLAMGGLDWRDIKIWKDKYSGQHTDGKFGLDLFKNKIIEFDFDKEVLIIENKMPRKAKKYDKLPLLATSTDMYIKAICQIDSDSFENSFLIHTGYGGSILLDDDFANQNKIGQRIEITGERILKDAFGNEVITKKGTLPIFNIGEQQLANAPIGFFEGAIGRQKLSLIGGDLFKRFNWIIDAERESIYLKPNKLFSTKFASI